MTKSVQFTGRKMVLTAMILILALFASACGGSQTTDNSAAPAPETNTNTPSEAPTDTAAQEEIPLNIGTLKIAALTNLYAADKLGYFKEEGLKVTFTQMGGGAELLPAVSAGQIDITLSIPSPAIQAREKGFDFKMVMQNEISAKEGEDSQAIFVRADSGINGLQDLKGKQLAVNNIGNQTWLAFVEVLEMNGVDKKDVNFLELPFPNMEDALVNKQIDAVYNVEPFTSKMLTNADLKAISYPATESLPGQPAGAFWASEKWLASNGQTAEKFVNAMKKATAYLAEHPEETNTLIAEYTGLPPAMIENMKPIIWTSEVEQDTLQGLLDLMKKHGLLEKEMKVEEILHPTALQ